MDIDVNTRDGTQLVHLFETPFKEGEFEFEIQTPEDIETLLERDRKRYEDSQYILTEAWHEPAIVVNGRFPRITPGLEAEVSSCYAVQAIIILPKITTSAIIQ